MSLQIFYILYTINLPPENLFTNILQISDITLTYNDLTNSSISTA